MLPNPGVSLLAAGAACLLAACATVVPLQTASTVPEGALRTGAQVSHAPPVCGFGHSCAAAVTLPEFRFTSRLGLTEGLDVGASLFVNVPRAGGFLEVKKELLSRDLGDGRKQVVSAGLGAGGTAVIMDGDRESRPQIDVAVPLLLGHQFKRIEVFAGPFAYYRWDFLRLPELQRTQVLYTGASLGFMTRRTQKFGMQLSYQAPWRYLEHGSWTVSLGGLWDQQLWRPAGAMQTASAATVQRSAP